MVWANAPEASASAESETTESSKRMLSAFFAAPLKGATPDDSAAQRAQMTRLDGIKTRCATALPAAADAAIAVRLAFTIEGVEHKLGSV